MSGANHSFFEVSTDEIAQLRDSDLRGLVAELCRAEFRQAGLDPTHVRSGGHQNAPDGGFDVEITIPPDGQLSSQFLQRSHVGIQVKKTGMPPAKIIKEMQPNGSLRPAIASLVAENGAYIIVSSESVSSSYLHQRIGAMKKAMTEDDSQCRVLLHFIDGSALAEWVQKYPGMILWVKAKIGQPQQGWKPFESWVRVPKGGKDNYILGEGARLFDARSPGEEGCSLIEGVNRLRRELSRPGAVIRLVGLSGVGKTRFVQALFEDSIEGAIEAPLEWDMAVYTDVAARQQPTPTALIEQFAAQGKRAIVILDNCGMELHAQADIICRKANSQVSMISIEYDVREDIAFETGVFRLEPSGNELIERLVHQHYPHISHVDAHTIAEFSLGNAGIAYALADRIKVGETVSGFKDKQLFHRLFFQGQAENESLLRCAKALSLVYSYNVEDVQAGSELAILGEITGCGARDLYSASVELKKRHLVQARAKWRAVLPHAIANRLAENALQEVPDQIFHEPMESWRSERLVQSFSRRLGFLHDCLNAVDIVETWLRPDGWLGRAIVNPNSLELAVLENIAPVSPESMLSAIEHAAENDNSGEFASRKNTNFNMLVGLLRSIAYYKIYFDRCMVLLLSFAASEDKDETSDSIRSHISSMFSPYLSGTQASVDQRAAQIKKLFCSGDENSMSIGANCLRAALKTHHFSSFGNFNFGARPRNFGYEPHSREAVIDWYNTFIDIAAASAQAGGSQAALGRKILASHFRGLWSCPPTRSKLESIFPTVNESCFWPEGWRAVRMTLYFDVQRKGGKSNAEPERLIALEEKLHPAKLEEKAEAYILAERSYGLDCINPGDINEDSVANYNSAEKMAETIGAEVAKNKAVLLTFLPKLFAGKGTNAWYFGRGLAANADRLGEVWQMLKDAALGAVEDSRDNRVLAGFIRKAGEINPSFVSHLLDELVDDAALGFYFPYFQNAADIDENNYQRLIQSIDSGLVPVRYYSQISSRHLNDEQVAEIVMRIIGRADGPETAVDILHMYFYRAENQGRTFGNSILRAVRRVMELVPIETRNFRLELSYQLSLIMRHVLRSDSGEEAARDLCARFLEECSSSYPYMPDYRDFLAEIINAQPWVFLDSFVEGASPRRMLDWDYDESEHPALSIPNSIILSWCGQNPNARCIAFARQIELYQSVPGENTVYVWWPLFWDLYECAVDKHAFLSAVGGNIIPSHWSGDRSFLISSRECLFTALLEHTDAELREWAEGKLQSMREDAAANRLLESERKVQKDERFE